MGVFLHDLSHAFRGLLRSPGFTATAVLTLALGIGANSAIFALVDATLLRPLPFRDPDQVVILTERTQSMPPWSADCGPRVNQASMVGAWSEIIA